MTAAHANFPKNQGPYAVLFFDLNKFQASSKTATPKPYYGVGFGLVWSTDDFRILLSPDSSLALVSGKIDSSINDRINLSDIDPFGTPHSCSSIFAHGFWEDFNPLGPGTPGATIKFGQGTLANDTPTSFPLGGAPQGGSIVTILRNGMDFHVQSDPTKTLQVPCQSPPN